MRDYEIRTEWGEQGLLSLAPDSDVIVIVDVLSFCTCVDIAVSRGAKVIPHLWKQVEPRPGLIVATGRGKSRYSLSPVSLLDLPCDATLVLPSPNGATLATLVADKPTFAGCFRNAAAIAETAQRLGRRISVVAAGERWPDGSVRFAIEDWLGAGAVIAHLSGHQSPEAQLAARSFAAARDGLLPLILHSCSGQELVAKGFQPDVELACQTDASRVAPRLQSGVFEASRQ
jgi:2-phosphosulfolactate phosphatase